MTHSPQKPHMTPDAYLSWEEKQLERHEYLQGTLRAMSGGGIEHNQIITNLVTEIQSRLKGTPCRSFTSSQRVQSEGKQLYFYPDVGIYCGSPHRGIGDSISNPKALFEVLSPSTEYYDRFEKFRHYQQIKSLYECFLVHQDSALIEAFRRMEGEQWSVSTHTLYMGLEATLRIESVGIALSLRDIFDGIEFANTEPSV